MPPAVRFPQVQQLPPSRQSCCLCCELKPGTTAIGIVYVLLSLILIITSAVHIQHEEDGQKKDISEISLGTAITQLLLSMLLVYGVVKGIAWTLLPFFVWLIILTVLYLGFVIYLGIDSGENGLVFTAVAILICLGIALLQIYFLVVIFACHKLLTWEKMTGNTEQSQMSVVPYEQLRAEDA